MHPKKWTTGYCTNIHSGTDLASLEANLVQFAGPVRQQSRPHGTLGVGLWIPNEAAEQLISRPGSVSELRHTLDSLHLVPYTFNGFPYGNFHEPVVKHRVYEPTWAERARLDYTIHLVRILSELLTPGTVGSISTLPIGWSPMTSDAIAAAGEHLRALGDFLQHHESDTGQRIVVAIEPEPGCVLDTAADVVAFFDRYLPSLDHRRYITVCHDVCHAAVMYESQSDVLATYVDNGIGIGKFQISSAIEVPWSDMEPEARERALAQLREFAEDRYLHQTGRIGADGQFTLEEDLPQVLQRADSHDDVSWRIHFHVPIFLAAFGQLKATRDQILECLDAIAAVPPEMRVNHMEVETYAWSVLPESMRHQGLAESIAAEMMWLDNTLQTMSNSPSVQP